MAKQPLFLLLCWLFCASAFGQSKVTPHLQADKTSHDFGDIVQGSSTVVDFRLVNTGQEEVYMLGANFPEDCRVRYSTTTIKPGDTCIVRVKFNPRSKGRFDKTITINTGDAPKPFALTIKGKVNYIDEGADPACPDFTRPQDKSIKQEFTVQVIDGVQEQPIHNAILHFSPNHTGWPRVLTDREGAWQGSLSVGLYDISASATGYRDSAVHVYIGKGVTSTVIVLMPLPRDSQQLAQETEHKPIRLPDLNIFHHKADTTTHDTLKEKPGELPMSTYAPNNIVFLIDVSSSMISPTKLPLMKIAMKKLLYSLRSIDKVSIVTYASCTKVLMESTPADRKEEIAARIDELKAYGSTQGGKGIHEAYRVGEANFISKGNNQIFLATDGAFNLDKSDSALYAFISTESGKGFTLSVVGFGKNTRAIDKMQAIAQQGKGSYIHISDENEAMQVLVDEIKLRSLKQ